MERPRLISVDELRAAGALYVPPAWRKSLSAGRKERDLFSDLVDDEDRLPPEQDSAPEADSPDTDAPEAEAAEADGPSADAESPAPPES